MDDRTRPSDVYVIDRDDLPDELECSPGGCCSGQLYATMQRAFLNLLEAPNFDYTALGTLAKVSSVISKLASDHPTSRAGEIPNELRDHRLDGRFCGGLHVALWQLDLQVFLYGPLLHHLHDSKSSYSCSLNSGFSTTFSMRNWRRGSPTSATMILSGRRRAAVWTSKEQTTTRFVDSAHALFNNHEISSVISKKRSVFRLRALPMDSPLTPFVEALFTMTRGQMEAAPMMKTTRRRAAHTLESVNTGKQ